MLTRPSEQLRNRHLGNYHRKSWQHCHQWSPKWTFSLKWEHTNIRSQKLAGSLSDFWSTCKSGCDHFWKIMALVHFYFLSLAWAPLTGNFQVRTAQERWLWDIASILWRNGGGVMLTLSNLACLVSCRLSLTHRVVKELQWQRFWLFSCSLCC